MDVWRHDAGPSGGHVKLPADEELPGLAKHWWVCAEKCTEGGFLGTSKASLPPWHLERREGKTSVDAKDPCFPGSAVLPT